MVKTCSIPGPLRSLLFSTSMRAPIASANTPNGCEKLPPPITVLAGVEEEMFPVVASSAKLPLKPLNGKYPSLGSVVPSSATAAAAGRGHLRAIERNHQRSYRLLSRRRRQHMHAAAGERRAIARRSDAYRYCSARRRRRRYRLRTVAAHASAE